MTNNLLKPCSDLDSAELRILLEELVGGPGQYHDFSDNPSKLYLPLEGSSCQIVLNVRDKKIVSIERGRALNVSEWNRICEKIENALINGPIKIGREYSFSSFRVLGS